MPVPVVHGPQWRGQFRPSCLANPRWAPRFSRQWSRLVRRTIPNIYFRFRTGCGSPSSTGVFRSLLPNGLMRQAVGAGLARAAVAHKQRRHWALTDSRPCANVRRFIHRLAHFARKVAPPLLGRPSPGDWNDRSARSQDLVIDPLFWVKSLWIRKFMRYTES